MDGDAPARPGAVAASAALTDTAAAPLVSVVVPTFNSARTLPAMLASLEAQTERNFELVISDGGSTDATLQLARDAAERLPHCRLLSRPDQGIYDAINLGISSSRGEWVLVLGSDDALHAADTLQRMAPLLRHSAADLVHGDVRLVHASPMGAAGQRHAGPVGLHELLRGNICQQAVFYRRSLFARLGTFDLACPVLADWLFNVRAALGGPIEWVDVVVADYAANGLSARHCDAAGALAVARAVQHELLARRGDRTLWQHHRVLLRQADHLRRRGHWRAAGSQLLGYCVLRCTRALRR